MHAPNSTRPMRTTPTGRILQPNIFIGSSSEARSYTKEEFLTLA